MSVLRSIEQKIEGLFEGMFGRAFRTHVQPVELARKLAKEMDEHRTISVSRVYVPNEYSVYLSEADRAQFAGYEGSLIGELQDYLVEHARRESYALLTPPKVLMHTDADLSVGEFGIATRVVQPEGKRGPALDEPAAQVEPGATMIYKAKQPQTTEAASPAELGVEEESFSLTMNGRKHAVEGNKVVLGRSKDCDVQVEDANVSRRHAELRREGASWWLVDLDSTNGTELNGKRVRRMQLADGDTITLGATDLVFAKDRPAVNIAVDEALLILKIGFIVLLYLFIWRIVRSASRDFRTGPAADSVIMSPTDAAALGLAPVQHAKLVVLKSPALDVGEEVPVDSMPVAVGRGGQNEVPLDGDDFASAQHARFESRRDGLWVEDIGSTNGTFVNGARVTTPRRLSKGDVVRVGQTDFKVEV